MSTHDVFIKVKLIIGLSTLKNNKNNKKISV